MLDGKGKSMFKYETELQDLVHRQPEIVLSGIPEISPDYCSDVPTPLSLGRELPLASGPIDNLFIDANAILTFVECKRHGDSRLKREVYAQAINYASDLQNMLLHFNGVEFLDQLFALLSKAQDSKFHSFAELCSALENDPVLVGKDITDWRNQFKDRLEFNIKRGIFRIVILCGASPESRFSAQMVRNLMQLMTYSERDSSRYDLLLMDVSESGSNDFVSKIVWRRYAPLPQIPLLASASRDTSQGVEAMLTRRSVMKNKNPMTEEALVQTLNSLDECGYSAEENTHGLAILKNKKSIYILIRIEDHAWKVVRHQIRQGEILHSEIEANNLPAILRTVEHQLTTKSSSANGVTSTMYELTITPALNQPIAPEIFGALSRRDVEKMVT